MCHHWWRKYIILLSNITLLYHATCNLFYLNNLKVLRMSAKKPRKNGAVLTRCEKCQCVMLPKDLDDHLAGVDCLASIAKCSHSYISNGTMYGTITINSNEDNPKDNHVFLSELVMDICDITLGCEVFVKDLETHLTYTKIARLGKDKHLMSIQLTKPDFRKIFCKENVKVSVRKAVNNVRKAQKVNVVCLKFNGDNYEDMFLESALRKNLENTLIKVGLRFPFCYFGEKYRFEIKNIEGLRESDDNLENKMNDLAIDDDDYYQVVSITKWQCYRNKVDFENEINTIALSTKIGALNEQMFQIRRLMDEVFDKKKRTSVGCGILLHGFPGTGKTLMATALAEERLVNFVELTFNQISDQFGDYSKINRNHLFGNKPTIILLDKFEEICPFKSSLNRDERVVAQGLTNLFNLLNKQADSEVFVIAITNKLDLVNPSFRKFPYLYPEIEVPIPNPEGRLEILTKLVQQDCNDLVIKINDVELQEIANSTHGYVGLDLQCLCLAVFRQAENKEINFETFKAVLSTFKPQAMRDSNLKVPNVKWSDIGGQEKLKKTLRLAIEMPIKHKDKMKLFGLKPLKGVLMFGPPGCSKTMVGKAMATESGLNFFSVNGSELYSKWVGDSERAVKEIFRKARQVAPSVIFFDEFDALGAERSTEASSNVQDRVLSQLLTEFDGIHSTNDVIVIAATNRPEKIDKALLRPGRFDRIVYVPLPDSNTRRDIFRIKLLNRPVENFDLDYLVQATESYSGAEINEIYSMAAMMALETDCEVIKFEHFTEALKLITPMTSPSLLKIYEEFKCFCR